jgi:hypothetical protein
MAGKEGGSELDAGMAAFGQNPDIKNSPAETLGKLIGIGNLDSAAKAGADLTTNLEKAMSQLTQPIASFSNSLPKSTVLGDLLGKQEVLNFNASPQDIIGDMSNIDNHQSEQQSNHQDHGSDQHDKNHQEYNPHEDPNLGQQGQKVLSGGQEDFEHHDHVPHVQPQIGGSSVHEHDEGGRGH